MPTPSHDIEGDFTDLESGFVGSRKLILINWIVDALLFAGVLAFPANAHPREALWHRILVIMFLFRIVDYSGGRPSLFFRFPRFRSELNPERDLTLFAAYKLSSRVWLTVGALLSFALSFRDPSISGWVVSRAPAILWALLVFQVQLPKRLLLWKRQ